MKNLIICEGPDDMLIAGYYLHKTSDWERINKPLGTNELAVFKPQTGQRIECYVKNDSTLDIIGIGGKDRIGEGIKYFAALNLVNPSKKYDNVIFLADRDDNVIDNALCNLQLLLERNGIRIDAFCGNYQPVKYSFCDEGKIYFQNIIPAFIPYSNTGALEDMLVAAIGEKGEQESRVVDYADQYIKSIINDDKIDKFLKGNRLCTKARFSAVLSIMNPDHSTGMYNDLLMSYPWEEYESVRANLKVLNEYIM